MGSSATETPRLIAVEYDPFASPDLERVVPTTEPQREVWLADRLGREASLAFNESISLRFSGALNVPALKSSVQRLVERHESLRATFSADGSDLCIGTGLRLDIAETDLSQSDAAERERRLEERRAAHVSEPFDLEHGPLVRAEVVRLSQAEHELIVTAHHIVCDGWSFWVLVRDFASLYRLQIGAPEKPLAPADSFAEYARAEALAEQTEDYARHEQYWLGRFSGGAPVLDLPTDRPRPSVRSFAAGREDYVLESALVADSKRAAAKHGASLFAAVMATFAVLLHRLSGQSQVVIGVPAAGQSVGGHGSLVGHCVNLLPVCVNIDQALGQEMARFPDVHAAFIANARRYENFELFVNAAQIDGALRLECQYNKGLYDLVTVRRWLECFEALMRGWIADPATSVNHLPLVGDAGLLRLEALQRAPTAYPREATIVALIESCIDGVAERTALAFGEERWSYAQLERRANQIAHCLRSRGVQRNSRVGICLERSAQMVAALLGVLKAGGGYVPLDPAYPSERLRFMVEDAGLAALVSHSSLAPLLQFAPERTLLLDAQAAEIEAAPATRLPRDAQAAEPRSLAYLIYTSGSTGKPKGVQVPHQAVVNFLCSMQREPGLSPEDRLLAVTTISFDIHVLEIWTPLTLGAQVVLASRETLMEGPVLRALIENSRATCMQATPALWRLLLEAGWSGGKSFKALCGGEALAPDLAERLLERCGELWNLYGPTETTVWSTCGRVSNPRAGISIGRPIANTTVHILDEQRQLCPIGVPGEIYIGGDGVTLGYLNRAELTSERFLPDPHSDLPEARLYRTGDRGRWLANGTLEHLGRLDFQVKVRGFRIELGEIEAALEEHEAVKQAVAVVRGNSPDDTRIVAYVTFQPEESATGSDLRRFLRKSLPEYMLPNVFVELDELPLTENGKVNRRALPPPEDEQRSAEDSLIAPRTALEKAIAAIWQNLLGVQRVSVRDNFFDLGGHSLLAAQMVTGLAQTTGYQVRLRSVIFETLEQIAAGVGKQSGPVERATDGS
jgi:amino acid adenylation domain-containing protein